MNKFGRAPRAVAAATALAMIILISSSNPILAESKKNPETPRERRYKISDLKNEPSPFEREVKPPTKWEQFLSLTAAITLLWTGRIGEVNYRGGGNQIRVQKN